jgi:hypothetical protein
MIGTTAAVAVLCGLGGSAAAVVTSTRVPSATVVLSTYRAGARPVAVTVRLRYEMQCGWPGPGPLTIRLPAAMPVPLAIPPAAVLIDGKPAKRVGGSGHGIVLDLPPRSQILCDVIAPGTLTIALTRAATLENPKTPGAYRLHATKGSLAFVATLTIRPR